MFDCRQPASLARFWASVLDGYEIAPYDDAELERLAALGITDLEDDATVLVETSEAGPRIWFQRVPESKTTKNRIHIDLRGPLGDAHVDLVDQNSEFTLPVVRWRTQSQVV